MSPPTKATSAPSTKPQPCVACTKMIPRCPTTCPKEQCVITKGTCDKCPEAICSKTTTTPKMADGNMSPPTKATSAPSTKPPCKACPRMMPRCPTTCPKEKCVITESTCDKCAQAICSKT